MLLHIIMEICCESWCYKQQVNPKAGHRIKFQMIKWSFIVRSQGMKWMRNEGSSMGVQRAQEGWQLAGLGRAEQGMQAGQWMGWWLTNRHLNEHGNRLIRLREAGDRWSWSGLGGRLCCKRDRQRDKQANMQWSWSTGRQGLAQRKHEEQTPNTQF